MSQSKKAILLLAHGTPDELSDIPKYLSNVVSGRPMQQSVIDEITHRYGLIGKSPLTALTLEQGRLLSEALSMPVYVGMRNWKPYIVDTVRQMKADGVTEAVAICLAPQNSRTSVGLYRRAVYAEAAGAPETEVAPAANTGSAAIRIEFIEGWADHPKLAEAFAARLAPVLSHLAQETGTAPAVVFTAHSVPCRTIQTPPAQQSQAVIESHPGTAPWVRSSAERPSGNNRPAPPPDPYPLDAKLTAALVAERIPGLTPDRWYFAFQSQGMAGGPWIGPSVEDTLTALHTQGVRAVVLQAIGFLCDHVEILYDIDIAFQEHAAKLGMRLERPASLNDSPLLTDALADLARAGLERLAIANSHAFNLNLSPRAPNEPRVHVEAK